LLFNEAVGKAYIPGVINFLIASFVLLVGCFLVRADLDWFIQLNNLSFVVVVLIFFGLVLRELSFLTTDTLQFLNSLKLKAQESQDILCIKNIQSLQPLRFKVGDFHTISIDIFFIGIEAMINHTINWLIATEGITYA